MADRKLHKNLTLLDVLKRPATDSTSNCSNCVSGLVEKANCRCQKQNLKTLYWGQADWFFDGEGVGLHYQANQITKDAPQLDIYLTTEQTKKYCNLRFMNKCFKLVAEFATYL